MVFFFQAEDGIRDGHVTGVQTCALPIYGQLLLIPQGSRILGEVKPVANFGQQRLAVVFHRIVMPDGYSRSEERRVGKECRCRWSSSSYIEQPLLNKYLHAVTMCNKDYFS